LLHQAHCCRRQSRVPCQPTHPQGSHPGQCEQNNGGATPPHPVPQSKIGQEQHEKSKAAKNRMGNNKKKKKIGDCHHPTHYDPHDPYMQDTKVNEDEESGHDEKDHEEKAYFSRRQQQCFQRRQEKIKEQGYHLQVWWERAREVNRCTQIVHTVEWRVRLCFGFLQNLALSIHKNAREVMGNTSPGCYFLKAVNAAFHDLMEGKSLPPTATSLLGLRLKFIPTPRYAPSATDVAPSLDQIERDIGLKTFFAGRDQGGEIPKLRAKSSWCPPPPTQPDRPSGQQRPTRAEAAISVESW
jgi:hypothetical protein